MFHLLPLLYSFMKTYVTTFFHSGYAKRLEKFLPSRQLFFNSFAQTLITSPSLSFETFF